MTWVLGGILCFLRGQALLSYSFGYFHEIAVNFQCEYKNFLSSCELDIVRCTIELYIACEIDLLILLLEVNVPLEV